jgi:cytosine/adenosine deaminase-related metal-dependent hydrolase
MEKVYSAPLIFTNDGPPLKNGFIKIDETGKILEVRASSDSTEITVLNGVLIPGFVNAHCHLELSHLKGLIPEKSNGMTGFIQQVIGKRFSVDVTAQNRAMLEADEKMYNEGIVAVGDISNFNHSIEIKSKSKISYHTFVEVFGANPKDASSIFNKGLQIVDQYISAGLNKTSITPHAPYSNSRELLELINLNAKENSPYTIHMQESLDEIDFCTNKSGPMYDFFSSIGVDVAAFNNDSIIRPLSNNLKQLNNCNPLQLVHNTFTGTNEIEEANSLYENLYWCLCVNANLYITGNLPNLSYFKSMQAKVTIGTDSLASNRQLSVLEELKTIHLHEPSIPLEQLIKWATINGAKFLKMQEKFGKIKPGVNPGLVLIEGINEHNLLLTATASCKRIC